MKICEKCEYYKNDFCSLYRSKTNKTDECVEEGLIELIDSLDGEELEELTEYIENVMKES